MFDPQISQMNADFKKETMEIYGFFNPRKIGVICGFSSVFKFVSMT